MSELRFGGYRFGAEHYSPAIRAQARVTIQTARFGVVLEGRGVLKGHRFNDDELMLWRLESNATESQFLADPLGLVMRALQGAAEADWYYAYEKDYGREDEPYENESECQCCEDDGRDY